MHAYCMVIIQLYPNEYFSQMDDISIETLIREQGCHFT